MDAKVLNIVMLILSISSGVLSIGIGVYVLSYSTAENIHSLLKISFLLMTVATLSSLAMSNLNNTKRWESEE